MSRAPWVVALVATLGCGGQAAAPPPPAHLLIELRRDGASPEQIEHDLVEPLEAALAPVPGIAHTRATAEPDLARLWLELSPGADPAAVTAAVRERLAAVQRDLPSDATVPIVTLLPARATRRYFGYEPEERASFLLAWLYRNARRRLEAQPGVRRVEPCGAPRDEITIALDPAQLASRGVSIATVVGALGSVWADVPAGSLHSAPSPVTALTSVQLTPQVRLEDVARVEHGMRRDCRVIASAPAPAIVETVTVEPGTTLDPGEDRVDLATGPVLEGHVDLPGTATETAALLTRVRDLVVSRTPQLETLLFEVTAADAARGLTGCHVHMIAVLSPGATDLPAIAAALDRAVAAVPGVPPMRLHAAGLVEVEVLLTGADLTALVDTARRLTDQLRASPEAAASACDGCADHVSVVIELDHDRLTELGLPAAQVLQALAVTGPGLLVGKLHTHGERLDVRLTQPGAPADLLTPAGARVPLTAVAQMRAEATPTRIHREDRHRALRIWVRAAGGVDLRSLRAAVTARIAAVSPLPPGIQIGAPTPSAPAPR